MIREITEKDYNGLMKLYTEVAKMVIVIKNNSSEPIYDQIKKQILDAIMSGEIREGEGLPSIRGLARETI